MKKDFPNLTKNLKAVQYGAHARPMRDWLVLLAVCGFLLVASILANLWYFARVTGGESIDTDVTPSVVHKIDTESVNALFEQRESERARYLEEYRFVDPSS